MVKFQSLVVLISLSLWLTLCVNCENDTEGLINTNCKWLTSDLFFPLVVELQTGSEDEDGLFTNSMIGMPTMRELAWDAEVQKLFRKNKTGSEDEDPLFTNSMIGMPTMRALAWVAEVQRLYEKNKTGSEDEDRLFTDSMIGMPTMRELAWDAEVQRLFGKNKTESEDEDGFGKNWLPPVPGKKPWNLIESLMKTRPEIGKCWTLSGSLRNVDTAKIPPLSWNHHVLNSLFCFNDILDSVLINGTNNSSQSGARKNFVKDCKASHGLLIEESLPTRNIENNTECYRVLPCAYCQQEVIEIRRGDTMVWNQVIEVSGQICALTPTLIPATSVAECFLNGGRFIMNVQVPDKKLRCVSDNCKAKGKKPRMKVNSFNVRYNQCDEEEVTKAKRNKYGKPMDPFKMAEKLLLKISL